MNHVMTLDTHLGGWDEHRRNLAHILNMLVGGGDLHKQSEDCFFLEAGNFTLTFNRDYTTARSYAILEAREKLDPDVIGAMRVMMDKFWAVRVID